MQGQGQVSARRAVVVAALAVAILGWSAQTPLAQARGRSDALRAGQQLRAGDSRTSRNARYRLLMRRDGNLMLYRIRRGAHRRSRAVWSTQTAGNRGAVAVMQRDGDFVVRSKTRKVLYASGTRAPNGEAPNARLVVRGNGSLAILGAGSPQQAWSSATDDHRLATGQLLRTGQSRQSPNGRYLLAMQRDGNLVLYDRSTGNALWSSQTTSPGGWTALQSDGNLVVYAADRTPVYSTATQADPGTYLFVQDDGNVVLYSGSNQPLWSSAQDVFGLKAGQELRPGQSRRSTNDKYLLTMQTDGNLVLADRAKIPLWNSQTGGHPGARTAMQADGNLVVYAPGGEPLFATGARGDAGSRMAVLDDGNVVVYSGANQPLWTSFDDVNTLRAGQRLRAGQSRRSPNGRYVFAMQPDGNLVLYDRSTASALWSSRTAGNAGAWAEMQGDGNFVVYSATKAPLFHTATLADLGSRLIVQDDSNVVVYDGANRPLWSWRTARA